MMKLNRSLASKPGCLNNFSYLTQDWDVLKHKHKKIIWKELDKIQNKFCVYCESVAEKGAGTGHIEHFFNKSEPAFKCYTFEWDNLFGCCDSKNHCGHFKDQWLPGGIKRFYVPTDLIKPDIEDPENFLQFLPSGKIKEKENLCDLDKKRALGTISALNLDCSELNLSRESQINRFNARLLVLTSVELTEEVLHEFEELYTEAMFSMHRTALKQAIPW